MNNQVNDNYITEVNYDTDFAYVLSNESSFLPTEYKMLQGQINSIFLKCMKMRFNGYVQLFYLTENYNSLFSILTRLNSDTFISIVANILKNIIDVRNHGFLSCRHIDISLNHIFVDLSTLKVKFVYIPVNNNLYENNSDFENEIRTTLIKIISEMSNINSVNTMNLLLELQNGSVSLDDIYVNLTGKVPNINVESNNNLKKETLKLVSMNIQPVVEVVVTKPEFLIGKQPSLVDGVIPFNKAISRTHCKIISKQNQYFIEDTNSANGTYLNNVRLQPRVPSVIKNGDIVRLANSEFQIILS